MADKNYKEQGLKLFKYITKERKDVANIYFYAIFSGLVQLSLPLGIQAIVSYAMGATMVTSIYLLIALVVAGTWLVGFFRLKVMQIIEKIQQKIFVEYSIAFAEKLPKLNLTKINKYFLPELVNRFFDTQNLQKGISKILLEIPTAIIQIIFGIILLSLYNPYFLIFGLIVLLGVFFIFRITMEQGIASSLDESDRKYEVASWLEDIASSVKTFKNDSTTKMHLHETDHLVGKYLEDRTSHFKVLYFQYKTIVFFKVVIILTMLAIATYLLINQQLNIGAFIATEIVVIMIMSAVEILIKNLESYYDMITAMVKLSKVLDLQEESTGEMTLKDTDQGFEIEFKNVSVSINDSMPILEDVNFKILQNSITAISGNLGTGKSILMNIFAGFYEPTAGKIFYDKTPFNNINKNIFRNQIGIFLEDVGIIKGNIFQNIQIGNPEITPEDITKAAIELGLDNFTEYFSNGYFTEISETDSQLSFSFRKMILLLRAVLGNTRLLLLEDPFEGFDETIKDKIWDYLQNKSLHKNIILATKEERFIAKADHHLFLAKGTVQSLK
ncbi:peptidase domain-containing ABC transporter [Halpernia frigidisoli]|uniref:ABC-type bacteriocin/lantibiotic exporter, contains an N-terminal double-glycine peptidase domain n=1 Tax=Halpernia frigidisoli TaxID=1125876 RepID=A0A1I3HN35_9FLAO|nr:ABC transporter ATP-binding protein [Halpernia frigidisoli]SFI37134.1 ABC-type bacteriocin/lantibiotic exporter, contains an N-terminal double-glycine peptidase domain [Halpernia frigidisoli]